MRLPPHFCIISCQHGPRDARAVHKLAAALRDAGFRVTWVGPREDTDFGEEGIEARLFDPPAARYARPLRWWAAYRSGAEVHDVDVYVGLSPDTAAIARKLARGSGAKFMFDLAEVYHQDMLTTWVPRPVVPLLGFVLRHLIGNLVASVDLLTASSQRVLAPYVRRCPDALILRNCAPTWMIPQVERTCRCEWLTVIHSKAVMNGSLDRRCTSVLLDALTIVKACGAKVRVILFDNFDEGPAGARDVFFRSVAAHELEAHLELHPRIPMRRMPAILARADVGIVAYNREFGVNSLAGRLFEYMAAGLAVIAPSYSPDMYDIVARERCGVIADCEDAQSLANALLALAQDRDETQAMGMRGKAAFIARYSWEREIGPVITRIQGWFQDRP